MAKTTTEVRAVALKPTKAVAFKLPKTMAACADAYYLAREARLAKEREAEELKKTENLIKQHLIDNLPKSDATGAIGKVAQVTVVNKTIPKVDNWDLFYAHIKKTGHFDLLNKALNKKAVEERWDNKKAVPGVESYTDITLSIHKLGGK